MNTAFSPYSLGVLLAIEQAGLATTATKTAGADASLAKLLSHAANAPLARKALLASALGAGGGGLLGAAMDKNRSRGVIRGAFAGAGLGLGGVLGRVLGSAGAARRALASIDNIIPESIAASLGDTNKLFRKLQLRAAMGTAAGGTLGLAAGSALGRSMVPPDTYVGTA